MKSLLACSALALMAVPAFADGPFGGSRLDWSGVYVGAHGAYADGGLDGVDLNYDSGSKFGQFLVGEGGSVDMDGWLAGVSVGANKQVGSIVFGIEADGSWGEVNGSADLPAGDGYTWRLDADLKNLVTLRGRLGFAAGSFLLYGTAGVAYGQTEVDEEVIAQGGGSGFKDPTTTVKASGDDNHVGWVAGAGIEWAVSRGWSLKAEWNHVDLGSAEYTFEGTAYPGNPSCTAEINPPDCSFKYRQDSAKADLDFDVFKIGAAYRF